MKHLDLQQYWLRNTVYDSLIAPVYVPTHENVVDLFTKAVKPQVVEFSVPKLGPTPYLLPFVDLQESVLNVLCTVLLWTQLHGCNLLSHVQLCYETSRPGDSLVTRLDKNSCYSSRPSGHALGL